ncbi:MAG: hypothetical protein NW214_10415, partial [Pseudanabaenaceae cyanobacterium bins.39]|nr:hypothetical protein [Pseudanabaenaceae cyanobacterium bins.39]
MSVAATSSRIAARAVVSAAAGTIGKPSRMASKPSRNTPLPAKARSQAASATGLPKGWAYSSKRCTKPRLAIG